MRPNHAFNPDPPGSGFFPRGASVAAGRLTRALGVVYWTGMRTPEHIASRTLVAVRADGSEHLVTLAVGKPYRASDVDWACPVALDGLYPRLADQHGIDSWQAMQLAYQLIGKLFSSFIGGGGKLLSPDEREPVQLSDLLPKPGDE